MGQASVDEGDHEAFQLGVSPRLLGVEWNDDACSAQTCYATAEPLSQSTRLLAA
jgi:hypothetical protein